MLTVASFQRNVPEQFEGFCFTETSDYVVGQGGFEEYRKHGKDIPPGLDGCYAVARKTERGIEIGSDSRGLRRLYLYQDSRRWVVASSLFGLVEYLRERGIEVPPNESQLQSLKYRTSLTSQSSASRTIFKNIVLIPSFCFVRVQDGRPLVEVMPEVATAGDYRSDLQRYVSAWASRFATLANHPMTQFQLDLSGGLDSRVVFAFCYGSGAWSSDSSRFRVASQKTAEADFSAATGILDKFGLVANTPGHARRSASSPESAIRGWKEACLGTYMPLYLNPYEMDPFSIHCHGSGGEVLREAFPGASIHDRIRSISTVFTDSRFSSWSSEMVEDLEWMSSLGGFSDLKALQYNEFRVRIHFGHFPYRRPTFAPLSSGLLDPIARTIGDNGTKVFYDVMDSLVPGLKNMPYDDQSKNPPFFERSEDALDPADLDVKAGKVFGGFETRGIETKHLGESYRKFFDLARSVAENSEVSSFVGDENFVQSSLRNVNKYLAGESRPRPNAAELQNLSYMASVGFVFDTF